MDTRLLLILFLIFPVFSLFSFDFSKKDVEYRTIYGIGFEIKDQQLIVSKVVRIKSEKTKTRFYYNIYPSDLLIHGDGYFYTTIFDEIKCIIPGSRYLYIFPENSKLTFLGYSGDFGHSVYLKDIKNWITGNKTLAHLSENYEINLISSIYSSSDLQEGDLMYDVSSLNKRILFNGAHLAWNGDAQPWVEGVTGPGIGETLTINFTEPSEDIVILNGFVDPLRRHLYRYNNRVKTAIIRSADTGETFEFEHTFEDVVHFDEIQLPRPAMKLIFEIKDVYPGEKWDDTCISAVLTREPDPYK